MLFVTHHIVFDGWSDGVLLREIATLYPTFINGNPSTLAKLPVQYADYAARQRQHNAGKAIETDLSYWQQQLKTPGRPLNLPADRPRPAFQTYRGSRRWLALPAQLSERLKALSKREQVTLFMTLLAAFKTLLYRYTGQTDISVGVPTAGRNRVETESLLGVFVNILVLRTDLSGEPSFRELLRREREVALGAYAHQDVPLEKLIEVSPAKRDLSRNPLFDVMFQLRNLPRQDVAVEGLRITPVDLDIGVTKCDLTLEAIDKEEGLECRFEYNTDLFDSSTIDRLAGHYQRLLESIAASSEQRISRPSPSSPRRKNTNCWCSGMTPRLSILETSAFISCSKPRRRRRPTHRRGLRRAAAHLPRAEQPSQPARLLLAEARRRSGNFGRRLCRTLARDDHRAARYSQSGGRVRAD